MDLESGKMLISGRDLKVFFAGSAYINGLKVANILLEQEKH